MPSDTNRLRCAISWAVLLSLTVLVTTNLTAQARRGRAPNTLERTIEAGIRTGYDFDTEDWALGLQVRLPIASIIELIPSGDYFLVDNGSSFQVNADLAVPLAPRGALYGGAGGGFFVRDPGLPGVDTRTKLGLNLFVGLEPGRLRQSRLRWFAEARWFVIEGDNLFRLAVGVNFPLGGRR